MKVLYVISNNSVRPVEGAFYGTHAFARGLQFHGSHRAESERVTNGIITSKHRTV